MKGDEIQLDILQKHEFESFDDSFLFVEKYHFNRLNSYCSRLIIKKLQQFYYYDTFFSY